MSPEDQSKLIATLSKELYFSNLNSPLGERMRHPKPGDVVVEVSSWGANPDPDAVGVLVRVEGNEPDEQIVVAPLHDPAHGQGWRNSQWIAVPTVRASQWLNREAFMH